MKKKEGCSMSAIRYRLKLEVGSANITLKLKTVLGDVNGLQEELTMLQEKGSIKKIIEQLDDKYSRKIEVHYFGKSFYNNKKDPIVKQ